jgi:mediator of RNA polymerase II transcription subunit 17
LRQEIAEAELSNGGADENDSSDEEDEEEPDRLKEVMTARDEMIKQIEYALSYL